MSEDSLREVLEERMEELRDSEEHKLEDSFDNDFDARDGAYYELSRLKVLIDLGKIEGIEPGNSGGEIKLK